jgi:hypothetical protein
VSTSLFKTYQEKIENKYNPQTRTPKAYSRTYEAGLLRDEQETIISNTIPLDNCIVLKTLTRALSVNN